MINSNARRAMAAAAGGSHINQISTLTVAMEYPASYVESEWEKISGSTTSNRLTASLSNNVSGAYVEIAGRSTPGVNNWYFTGVDDFNAGNATVAPNDQIWVWLEYSGVNVPQTIVLTLRNATFGNEIVWQVSLTIMPEPV